MLKVACGAAETVPLISVPNLARALEELQRTPVQVIGADGSAPGSIFELDLSGPVALVLGAEDRGLRRLTRAHCDHLARVPMSGSVQSLNLSVCAGVCLFETQRQRGRLGVGIRGPTSLGS